MQMRRWPSLTALGIALVASNPLAQGQRELELMLKWQMAEAVHYEVVAEYSGNTPIMVSDVTAYRDVVSDRFEISFDWHPNGMSLVGQPAFKNFPSKVPATLSGFKGFNNTTCPAPKPSGTFEYVDVTEVKMGILGANSLIVSARRTYMGGQIPYVNEYGCGNWATATAKSEMTTIGVFVPLGMWFAMPHTAGAGITVGTDGKTMVMEDKATGWKYTYTMTIK